MSAAAARAPREELAVVAIADIDEEMRAEGGAGEELGIDLLPVEASHRPGVEPDGTKRENEVAGLERAVIRGGAIRVAAVSAERPGCYIIPIIYHGIHIGGFHLPAT